MHVCGCMSVDACCGCMSVNVCLWRHVCGCVPVEACLWMCVCGGMPVKACLWMCVHVLFCWFYSRLHAFFSHSAGEWHIVILIWLNNSSQWTACIQGMYVSHVFFVLYSPLGALVCRYESVLHVGSRLEFYMTTIAPHTHIKVRCTEFYSFLLLWYVSWYQHTHVCTCYR